MENSSEKISIEVREIVFSNEEEKSFCDVFVYEPENIGEQALGNLYIVGEIVNVSENSSYLVNLLASIIKKEFYSNTKRSTVESLEASLHKANATLSDITEQGNIDWVGNLNMICAVYSESELHLSQTGNCKTLLIRNGQITDIGKNITKEEKTHPFRTFANIASGELETGDLALFATPEFFNVFSLEELRKLSLSLELGEFVEKIQDLIEREEKISTIGSLIMKIEKGEQEKDKLSRVKIESATEEIREKEIMPVFQERLEETDEKIKKWAEKETKEEDVNIFEKEEAVTDAAANISGHKEVVDSQTFQKEKRVSLEDIIGEYEETEKENGETEEEIEKEEKEKTEVETVGVVNEEENKEQDERKGVSLDDLIKESNYSEEKVKEEKLKKGILNKLLKTLNGIFSFIKIGTVSVANQINRKTAKKANDDVSGEVSVEAGETESPQRVKLIPIKNKHLLVVFAVVAIVLVWNVISTNYQNNQEEENNKFEKYSNVLSQAENKISGVESMVIYGDFEEAREILADAKGSVIEVKNEYEKLGDEANVLLEKIQIQLDRVDLVNRIDSPKIAIDLSQTDGLKDAGGIMKVDKKYYIFDLSDNNSLYQADFENSKAGYISAEGEDNIGRFKLSTAMTKTEEIIFLTDLNKIAVFSTDKEELNSREIKLSNGVSSAKDMASYSSYLYLLKPDSNQIYKHTRSASGFGEGEIWIKDAGADIKNAVSLAIDGSIYILKSDGSVDKYLRGVKDSSGFSIDKLGDLISNPTKIYTRSDLNYLYVVEPRKNRVILFDKIDGKLVKQYTSESFSGLKNIVVDNEEKKMYVLSGDKVFEVEIRE